MSTVGNRKHCAVLPYFLSVNVLDGGSFAGGMEFRMRKHFIGPTQTGRWVEAF